MSDLHVDINMPNVECQMNPAHKGVRVDEIIDGRLAGVNMWGWMCVTCHARYGVGLGMGRGQHYKRLSAGSDIFRKIGG